MSRATVRMKLTPIDLAVKEVWWVPPEGGVIEGPIPVIAALALIPEIESSVDVGLNESEAFEAIESDLLDSFSIGTRDEPSISLYVYLDDWGECGWQRVRPDLFFTQERATGAWRRRKADRDRREQARLDREKPLDDAGVP